LVLNSGALDQLQHLPLTWRKRKREKTTLQKRFTQFVCSNITMAFKALLCQCYAPRGSHRRGK